MNMKRKTWVTMAVVAALAGNVFSQIRLDQFNSRSTLNNLRAATKVKTLLVQTRVNGGLAVTRLTMELEPGPYVGYEKVVVGDPVIGEEGVPEYTKQQVKVVKDLDSVEITADFTIPEDFVAESLYLWIEGERVEGEIQDKALAWGQYVEIVGVRIDPALLQFHGNGRYNLRIFPAATGVARKITLVFHHTLDDESGKGVSATVPLAYDTANVYYYNAEEKKSPIGRLRVEASAGDDAEYRLAIKGVGEGAFSRGDPLKADKRNVYVLSEPLISSDDPSGGSDEYGWVGKDKRDGEQNMGFTTLLTEDNVELEDEPTTRTIVVDMRTKWWDHDAYYEQRREYAYPQADYTASGTEKVDIWRRAQKFAVLCLQNYVTEEHTFNLVFAGREVRTLFAEPVAPTAANLVSAYEAIRDETPDEEASTEAALEEALAQDPEGIVILISDLYQPYNYMRYLYDGAGNYRGYEISPEGKRYDELLGRIRKQVEATEATLFSICDDGHVSVIARNSGGFQLASLRYEWYYAPYVVEDGGTTRSIPKLPGLYLDNPYQGGITGIEVEALSGAVSDVVHTADSRYWWWGPMPLAEGQAPAKRARMPVYYGGRDSVTLRVAATTSSSSADQSYDFMVAGKMGGLGFTRRVSVRPASASRPATDVQWAFRKSEQLAMEDWRNNAPAIKKLGKDYHIVTRQTSLLALEPWMEMWKDTLGTSDESTNPPTDGRGAETVALSDQAPTTNTGDSSLDEVTLDELIAGKSTPVQPESVGRIGQDVSAVVHGGAVELYIPAGLRERPLTLKLHDARGRLVARKRISAGDLGGSRVLWRFNDQFTVARGFYTLELKAGSTTRRFTLAVAD